MKNSGAELFITKNSGKEKYFQFNEIYSCKSRAIILQNIIT